MSEKPSGTARIIIDRFGGIRPMSAKLGHENASTVQHWAKTGFIPARRQAEVLDAARKHGIELTAADFIGASPLANDDDSARADTPPDTESQSRRIA